MIIIVFDFDDTLFPSWHFSQNGFSKGDQLAQNINALISKSSSYGKVHIITNAESKWVKKCSEFLPDCDKLCENAVVFSTADEGYNKGDNHYLWKTPFFKDKLSDYFSKGVNGVNGVNEEKHHLIAFGDSPGDRLAALSLQSESVFVKNVLLPPLPTIDQLLNCHRAINNCLETLVKYQGNLDLFIKV